MLVHFATLDHQIENVVMIFMLLWAVNGAFKKKGKKDLKVDSLHCACRINQS